MTIAIERTVIDDVRYHISCLQEQGELLADCAAAAGLDALVPTCPGSGLDCWTFLDAPSPLAFWARRQAGTPPRWPPGRPGSG